MGKIVWLASYPRSGNTWMRVFIKNFLADFDKPVHINELKLSIADCNRATFDEVTGVEASNLTFDEIERYRPRVQELTAANSSKTLFIKIHDALTLSKDHLPIISVNATQGIIYLIRNPLDVAVSCAQFFNASIDQSIDQMADGNIALNSHSESISGWLRQRLLTWSGHAISWIDQSFVPVHVVRYEDMFTKPLETFAATARFAGLPEDPKRVKKALKFSSFAILQGQEQEHGFKEKALQAESFFWKGRAGTRRDVLSEEQRERIIADHREVMLRFGYLCDKGNRPL